MKSGLGLFLPKESKICVVYYYYFLFIEKGLYINYIICKQLYNIHPSIITIVKAKWVTTHLGFTE